MNDQPTHNLRSWGRAKVSIYELTPLSDPNRVSEPHGQRPPISSTRAVSGALAAARPNDKGPKRSSLETKSRGPASVSVSGIGVEISDEVGQVTSLALELDGVLGDLDGAGTFVLKDRTRVDEPFDVEERLLDLVRARQAATVWWGSWTGACLNSPPCR